MRTRNTYSIKYWNKCEPYIHLRWIKTSKRIISQAIYSSSGFQVAWFHPSSSGQKAGLTVDGVPFHCRVHLHTHTQRDNLDTLVHQMCTSLKWWRNPEDPKKIHADIGIMCRHHTVVLSRNQFFFLINIIAKQCWKIRHYLKTFCV